ncbi:PTS system mannose/fructose/sorbose family transporter subunit IID [Caproiciproducens sp. R1]|uniref:PTS system mannose/fructose/sorbose family transporter subunit IID n=1 Tax=Caproiciproducens sp. R1 TaxID=3435000 RepID=UPI004034D519
MAEKITKKDLNKLFWRLNLFQVSWNYERMQALAYLYTMVPVLKKVYADKPKEGRSQAIARHLEFFNTMPSFAAPVLGITAALEEKEGNSASSVISALKIALMGPLAGLGDSLIWLTWMPICMSIGASFASKGNPIGLLLALLMFNVVNVGIKYFGIHMGYNQGSKMLDNIKESNVVQRYTTMATILGLLLVGGLIPQLVAIPIPVALTIGKMSVKIQELLDGIVPSLLPMLLTLLCARLIKKRINAVFILLGIIVIAIPLVALGVLG